MEVLRRRAIRLVRRLLEELRHVVDQQSISTCMTKLCDSFNIKGRLWTCGNHGKCSRWQWYNCLTCFLEVDSRLGCEASTD